MAKEVAIFAAVLGLIAAIFYLTSGSGLETALVPVTDVTTSVTGRPKYWTGTNPSPTAKAYRLGDPKTDCTAEP